MKKNIFSALLLLLNIHLALSMETCFSPETTVIFSDLDDVLIKKSRFHKATIVLGGIKQDPPNAIPYLLALNNIKNKYKRDADGIKEKLCDKDGNSINGLTFHFLYHGSQDKNLAPYVPWLINTMEHSRCYIEGTRKIYTYLKEEKGYTIALATNKDRIAYDITEQAFGPDFASSFAENTFVAHPANNNAVIERITAFAQSADASTDYKNLAQRAINIAPSQRIHHTPAPKPDIAYYQYMQKTFSEKNIIFIDDKKENTTGFKQLQSDTDAQLRAIHFKSPAQLAEKFVKLGILSEAVDKKLLEEIRYPGMWGKIRLYAKKVHSILFS